MRRSSRKPARRSRSSADRCCASAIACAAPQCGSSPHANCGYNTLHYKLFVWTLSAVLCGIAGALYVPQVGIINPGEMSPANSIEIAIWVAVIACGRLLAYF